MSNTVIADSTCLIGLERIQRLDLLPKVFEKIMIPPAVQIEVGIEETWIFIQKPANRHVVNSLKTQLDPGESEAIALALEIPKSLIILDDLSARHIAKQIDITVIGTVGLILKAKQKGIITNVKEILNELVKADFRIAQHLIKTAIELADELE